MHRIVPHTARFFGELARRAALRRNDEQLPHLGTFVRAA